MTHDKKGEINMAASKRTTKSVAKAVETAAKAENIATDKDEVEKTVAAVEEPQVEEKEAAPKTAAKRATAKKPGARKTVKKADQKTSLHVQFSGKSYSEEDLIKMAQDVWKYDLKQKVRDLTSIDLYVKPEENLVYYVMNDGFTGSFVI